MKQYSIRQVRRTLKKYALRKTRVDIGDALTLDILGVEDPYALLDRLIEQEEGGRPVGRFPYWAEVWPAGVALARWFVDNPVDDPRPRALELGCGLGLVGITLAILGWQIAATDYIEDALVFALSNARRNRTGRKHQVAYLDWRHPVGQPHKCLVASDVVYEKKNHANLNRVLRHLLAPGGWFYLSDPQRPAARHFVALLKGQGYGHQVAERSVRWKSLEHQVNIHIFQKPPF